MHTTSRLILAAALAGAAIPTLAAAPAGVVAASASSNASLLSLGLILVVSAGFVGLVVAVVVVRAIVRTVIRRLMRGW